MTGSYLLQTPSANACRRIGVAKSTSTALGCGELLHCFGTVAVRLDSLPHTAATLAMAYPASLCSMFASPFDIRLSSNTESSSPSIIAQPLVSDSRLHKDRQAYHDLGKNVQSHNLCALYQGKTRCWTNSLVSAKHCAFAAYQICQFA